MSLDISRDRFRPERDYAAVVVQQGRVALDADANEGSAIDDRRMRAAAIDIGRRAFHPPAQPHAFRITAAADGSLRIGPGRYYVDGLVAENRGAGAATWNPALAEWVRADPLPLAAQPYPTGQSAPQPTCLLFLDLWRRPVTFLEQPDLVEPAVGIDSTARLQTVWQVRALPVQAQTAQAALAGPEWAALNAPPAARLTNGLSAEVADPDPCKPPPTNGYRSQENQLYRVEIHDGGDQATATWKWSRDNGSVATAVRGIDAARTRLLVDDVGRDAFLSFANGGVVEVTDEARALAGLPGVLARLAAVGGVDAAANALLLEAPLPAGLFPTNAAGAPDPARRTRVRRWDGVGALMRPDGTTVAPARPDGALPMPPAGQPVVLENGITAAFQLEGSGLYRTGDHWLFAARAADASIEPLAAAPPHGIHHHRAPLAFLTGDGLVDLRTTLGDDCGCTVCVPAGFDLAALPDLVPTSRRARICLAAGDYRVTRAVVLDGGGEGQLVITGCGPATRIVTDGEAALVLRRWASAAVEDLALFSGVDHRVREEGVGSRGALTAIGCAEVRYERVHADAAGATDQESAALRIHGATDGGAQRLLRARVSHCSAAVGPGCTGVLVTNAEAADVTGCRIRPSARKAAAAERPDVITRRGRALARPSEIAGIVVAGQIAREVRVAHNDILAERVGIRVALSRRARRSDREVVERVIVEGNRVSLAGARALAGRMRGIFIGNCESAIVCHNRLEAMIQGRKGDREELPDSRRVVKEDGTRADAGILMFGAFGRFANVRANHLSNWRTGIRMVAINMRDDKQARPLWVFAENLAERTDTVVDLPPIAINQHNQG